MGQVLDGENAFVVLIFVALTTFVGSRIVGWESPYREWGRRIAGLALIALVVDGLWNIGADDVEDFVAIVLRALAGAGIALGLAWMILPAIGGILQILVANPLRSLQQGASRMQSRLQEQRERRRREEADRQARLEWERAAPQRERRQREEEERRQTEAQQQTESRKRREEAHLQSDLLYDRYASELRDALPRDRYEALKKTYMSEYHAPDVVELRAANLQQLILSVVGTAKAMSGFESIADLAQHFVEQRREIDELPYGDDVKDSLHKLINMQERKAIERFLQ